MLESLQSLQRTCMQLLHATIAYEIILGPELQVIARNYRTRKTPKLPR